MSIQSVLSFLKKHISILHELAVLCLYALSFFVLTYPLIFHFQSGIIGNYWSDAPQFLWNAWEWGKKISVGDLSLFTHDVLYPFTNSLAMSTHAFVQSALVAGMDTIFHNIATSFNFVFLVSSVLSAYCAYHFFAFHFKKKSVAFLAGQFFAFQHLWAVYVLFGTQNILSLWYLSATFLAYESYRRRHNPWYLALTGIVLGLAFTNDFLMFTMIAVPLFLYILFTHVSIAEGTPRSLLQKILMIGASFLAVSGWYILELIKQRPMFASLALPTVNDVSFYHADFINLFRPSHFHLLWGSLSSLYRNVAQNAGNAFIGFTFMCVLLAVMPYWCVKPGTKAVRWKVFAIFLIIFVALLLLAVGPYLYVWGYATNLPMPYFWLHKIFALVNNFRVPTRWLLPATFWLAGLFGFMVASLFMPLKRRAYVTLTVVIYCGLLLDSLMVPKHILPVTQGLSPVFSFIAADTSHRSVIEVPLTITSGYFTVGTGSQISMLHQVIHHHPIMGGLISRLPFSVKNFYEHEPIVKYLVKFQTNKPDEDDVDPEKIKHFIKLYNPGFVVFNKQITNFSGQSSAAFIDYLKKYLHVSLYYEDNEELVYKMP